MEEYGADAVRWYLFVNNPPWKPTQFNEEDIAKTIISDFFRSLTNTYAFFTLYANIDGFNGNEEFIPLSERTEIDRWIISRVNTIVSEYRNYMDDYELTKAHRAIQDFVIYELSNWYIRRNRRRFWKGENDKDKIAAYQTLRTVLITVLSIMSPAAPFLSENLFSRLRNDNDPESIHLMDIPNPEKELIDTQLEERMKLAQTVVSLARSLREKAKLKVRQPLKRILIPVLNPNHRRNIQYFEDIIKEELNIKAIEYVSGDTDIVSRKAKADFKKIGKKFGKDTQKIANSIKMLTNEQIKDLEKKDELILFVDNVEYIINFEDVEISSDNIEGWLVAIDENVTVALDTNLTPELMAEGIAREFINRVQNLRKNMEFEVTDRIGIQYFASDDIASAIEKMSEFIASETLAEIIERATNSVGDKVDFDGDELFIKIEKK
jgi:isoleucyl-tRNA synthetase